MNNKIKQINEPMRYGTHLSRFSTERTDCAPDIDESEWHRYKSNKTDRSEHDQRILHRPKSTTINYEVNGFKLTLDGKYNSNTNKTVIHKPHNSNDEEKENNGEDGNDDADSRILNDDVQELETTTKSGDIDDKFMPNDDDHGLVYIEDETDNHEHHGNDNKDGDISDHEDEEELNEQDEIAMKMLMNDNNRTSHVSIVADDEVSEDVNGMDGMNTINENDDELVLDGIMADVLNQESADVYNINNEEVV